MSYSSREGLLELHYLTTTTPASTTPQQPAKETCARRWRTKDKCEAFKCRSIHIKYNKFIILKNNIEQIMTNDKLLTNIITSGVWGECFRQAVLVEWCRWQIRRRGSISYTIHAARTQETKDIFLPFISFLSCVQLNLMSLFVRYCSVSMNRLPPPS